MEPIMENLVEDRNVASDRSSQNGEPDTSTPAPDEYQDIDWNRIPKFHMPSQRSQRRAWIWTQGYDIEETQTSERYFLCKKCHTEKRLKKHMWKISGGTGVPLKHLKEVHCLTEKGPVAKKGGLVDAFRQSDGSLTPRDRDIVHQLVTGFNPKRFKVKLTRWIVQDNIAFQQVESPYFRDMMLESNTSLEEHNCLPAHRSIRDWITKDFERYKEVVKEQLQNALGKVHISFNLWSSRNLLALCGIVVHFINKQGKLCTFLLSLPEIAGSHTGTNIAESVAAILNEFALGDRVGYFVLDNAENNDTAIAALGDRFEFNPDER
jgi:hypothetical protein